MMKNIFLVLVISISALQCYAKLTMEQKMTLLRNEMNKKGIEAYIIPAEDEHQSEYVAKYDKRRAWISGFTGSAGTAVVTKTEAAVWTDGRYYLQAIDELDPTYWKLMKASESETLKIEEWLARVLKAGDRVGQMAKFTSIDTWQSRESQLDKSGIIFEDVKTDLIDAIWPSDERDEKPSTEIKIHDIKFAGTSWQAKIEEVKRRINQTSADLFVVTALDEIAWLFNLRASDLPNNPMFYAYAIIMKTNDTHNLYVDPNRITAELRDYLKNIVIKDYNSITNDITAYSNDEKTIWVSPMSSYAIYGAVTNKTNMVNRASPIRSIKARKTLTELENMRDCNLRDSVARIRHMYWLFTEMNKGNKITEKTSSDKLKEIQKKDPLYESLSFGSISAVGENAAIIHYNTEEGNDAILTKNKIYMLDAGAQYQDCTTDVTRTHHFGTPSTDEKYFYTRVLQGQTNLAKMVFPNGIFGRDLDIEARLPLWRDGQDYGHGTGHGIGYFLSVHENPPRTNYLSRDIYQEGFEAGMIQSDEPGFYAEGKFGIRLETDIETVRTHPEYQFRGRAYLKFEPLTWVPFDKNLIDECLLTNDQVDWLNKYNKDIRDKVNPRLSNYPEVREWLNVITEPFMYAHQYERCRKPLISGANAINSLSKFILVIFSTALFFIIF